MLESLIFPPIPERLQKLALCVRHRTEQLLKAFDNGPQFNLKGFAVLYTIAVILVILWLLGMVTSYTLGGFVHILLVIAIVAVLLRVIRG